MKKMLGKPVNPAKSPNRLGEGYEFIFEDVRVLGYSIAGITTTLTLPQYKIAFDVGQGLPFHMGCDHFFITHAHMDHCYGVPYLIAQKTMMSHVSPQIYAPDPLYSTLPKIMKLWQEIEEHSYGVNLNQSQLTSIFSIQRNLEVRVFKTFHRVPSVGYSLIRKKTKLKGAFQGLNSEELKVIREAGETLQETVEETLFSFTGDTTSEFWQSAPEWVKSSKILAIDCTFIDSTRSIEQARLWGHTHLDEIIPMINDFTGGKILLVHLSARYTSAYVEKVLKNILSEAEREKIAVLPRPL